MNYIGIELAKRLLESMYPDPASEFTGCEAQDPHAVDGLFSRLHLAGRKAPAQDRIESGRVEVIGGDNRHIVAHADLLARELYLVVPIAGHLVVRDMGDR